MVLNTSFNIRGEPIVHRPEQAVECFLKTGMDALFLGDYMLTKTVDSAARELTDEQLPPPTPRPRRPTTRGI